MSQPNQIHLNRKQRLFVLPVHGGGFTCLGFDVCEERIRGLATELNVQPQPHRNGTHAAYAAYRHLVELACQKHQESGWRSESELTTELMGLEGKRVEVVDAYGETRRFYVGKSTGFIPCHLEICRRDSSGGPAVMGAPFKSVRTLEAKRYD